MASMFGIGRPGPSAAEQSEMKVAAMEAEMKLLADMHNRLTKACAKKCIPPEYREGELNKGESVCLDRCASKFFEVHMKVSDIMQQNQQKAQGGGIGGFGA